MLTLPPTGLVGIRCCEVICVVSGVRRQGGVGAKRKTDRRGIRDTTPCIKPPYFGRAIAFTGIGISRAWDPARVGLAQRPAAPFRNVNAEAAPLQSPCQRTIPADSCRAAAWCKGMCTHQAATGLGIGVVVQVVEADYRLPHQHLASSERFRDAVQLFVKMQQICGEVEAARQSLSKRRHFRFAPSCQTSSSSRGLVLASSLSGVTSGDVTR